MKLFLCSIWTSFYLWYVKFCKWFVDHYVEKAEQGYNVKRNMDKGWKWLNRMYYFDKITRKVTKIIYSEP